MSVIGRAPPLPDLNHDLPAPRVINPAEQRGPWSEGWVDPAQRRRTAIDDALDADPRFNPKRQTHADVHGCDLTRANCERLQRVRQIVGLIAREPGLSRWEMAKRMGVSERSVQDGLSLARTMNVAVRGRVHMNGQRPPRFVLAEIAAVTVDGVNV